MCRTVVFCQIHVFPGGNIFHNNLSTQTDHCEKQNKSAHNDHGYVLFFHSLFHQILPLIHILSVFQMAFRKDMVYIITYFDMNALEK